MELRPHEVRHAPHASYPLGLREPRAPFHISICIYQRLAFSDPLAKMRGDHGVAPCRTI